MGLLDHMVIIFSFLRSLHTILHSDCTNVQSNQQCKWAPFSPHPLQHCYLLVLVMAILTWVRASPPDLFLCAVAQSCLTLCSYVDCRPPGPSVYGRILEWGAISYSRGSSQPEDRTCVSYIPCVFRWILYHCRHLGSPLVTLIFTGIPLTIFDLRGGV